MSDIKKNKFGIQEYDILQLNRKGRGWRDFGVIRNDDNVEFSLKMVATGGNYEDATQRLNEYRIVRQEWNEKEQKWGEKKPVLVRWQMQLEERDVYSKEYMTHCSGAFDNGLMDQESDEVSGVDWDEVTIGGVKLTIHQMVDILMRMVQPTSQKKMTEIRLEAEGLVAKLGEVLGISVGVGG